MQRYLLTIYALTLGGILLMCAVMAGDPKFRLAPMMVISPLLICIVLRLAELLDR